MPSKRGRESPYPWDTTETPGPRLRAACDKTRSALEQVNAPGFHAIAKRVDAVVRPARPLVETMDYLARKGLRTSRGQSVETVDGKDVSEAVRAVREALVALHASTALTQSTCYEAFAGALETLMGLAEAAVPHGITGTGGTDSDDLWEAFGATSDRKQ